MLEHVQKSDSKIADLIRGELTRQQTVLEMIPSENMVSPAVLEAMGSVLTNKYSEGYPHKRYYGGNEVVDQVEDLAIERAKAIFKCEHVNVQPYSGSPANMEVYFALLEFGDTAMGMSLSEGGHLTHGHPVSYSGKAYQFTQYGVSKQTELLDYDAIEKMAKEVKPKIIVSGHSAYPRQVDFKRFAEIAESVGAISMADIAHVAGLVVAGEHPSPFPYTDVVTTTTHKTLRGPRGAMIMCKEKFAKAIDKAVFPGMQGGPHEHIIAAKAVAFAEAATPEFAAYAKQIVKNAKALGESLSQNGIRLVTGGTDNHLVLCDLSPLGVSGKQAETALDLAHITVNKNTIPFDPRTPFDPSGIRVGTPVLTTRGMKEEQMAQVGELIARVCKNHDKQDVLDAVKKNVVDLCAQFPLYQELG